MANKKTSLRDKVHKKVDLVMDKAEGLNEKGMRTVENLRDNIDSNIQNHPEKSLLIAAGIGALIGAVIIASMMRRN